MQYNGYYKSDDFSVSKYNNEETSIELNEHKMSRKKIKENNRQIDKTRKVHFLILTGIEPMTSLTLSTTATTMPSDSKISQGSIPVQKKRFLQHNSLIFSLRSLFLHNVQRTENSKYSKQNERNNTTSYEHYTISSAINDGCLSVSHD